MKLSQSLIKDVLNGCCRHYYQLKYVENVKTEPTKAMFDGLYFESALLGTARDGVIEYPPLKNGGKSKGQKDIDEIIDLARSVLENSGIEIKNVQERIESDDLQGHIDFRNDKIYDVKFTGETFDRWNKSFQWELHETMDIQARHYQTIMYSKGFAYDVAFLIFSSHGWFRYILFPFDSDRLEDHKIRIEAARERLTELEEPTALMCSNCRLNKICKNRVMRFEIENIDEIILRS